MPFTEDLENEILAKSNSNKKEIAVIISFYFPIKISIKSATADSLEEKYSFRFNYNILFKTLHGLLK